MHAVMRLHPQPIRPDGVQVRAARDERDLRAAPRQPRRDVPADGAGTKDADPHESSSSAARDRACTPSAMQRSSGGSRHCAAGPRALARRRRCASGRPARGREGGEVLRPHRGLALLHHGPELGAERGEGGLQHAVVVDQRRDHAAVVERAGDAHRRLEPLRQAADRRLGRVARLGVQGADGALQVNPLGDDVVGGAAGELADGDDGRVQGPHLAAHHRLRLRDEGAGGDDRVHRGVGMRGVAGAAAHLEVEAVGGGEAGAAGVAEAPDRQVRLVVEAERHVHALAGPVGDHGGRALQHLLRRLEHQQHAPGQHRRHALEHLRHAEQRGRVDVVAAGMHLPGRGAGEGQPRFLGDRQRVHVGPDGKRRPRPPALDPAEHARPPDPRPVRDAEAREFRRDDAGGPHLLEGEFGMGVDVAAQRDEPRLQGLRPFPDAATRIVHQHMRALPACPPPW
jgi:hypothetical protein